MDPWPLGVFASIDAGLGVKLEVAHELAIPTVHLHAPHADTRTPELAAKFLERLKAFQIRISCVFGGFDGESYADIPTVARTVGLVPPGTRTARTQEMKEISDFARILGVGVVGLHVGCVPHDPADADYGRLLVVMRDLCDHARKNGQDVHLETGQEPADVLLKFLEDTARDNLFINFDPANLILYGVGQPLEDLRKVGRYVRSVHMKDGRWSDQPGITWGKEVPLGEGDVNIPAYMDVLKEIGYVGPLTIEREIPEQADRQKAEIRGALDLVRREKSRLGMV